MIGNGCQAVDARARGIAGGWALDRACVDPVTGRKWNFDDAGDVRAAWNLFYKTRPKLLVCSPPCTLFSQIQGLNGPPDPEKLRQAIQYLEICISMCKVQHRAGRKFIFEHPA